VGSKALAVPLAPHPVARPWGGRTLGPRFGWTEAGADRTGDGRGGIGEWWLASCHPSAVTSLRDSPLTLPAWLDGPGRALGLSGAAAFPLLLKFLDCEEILSLQVHPDDAVATRQGLPRGKTEAWHVVQAAPGACVWLGTAPGVRSADLLDAVASGAGDDEVRALLRRVPVTAGDTLLVAAGTVHAIGPGLQLFEVQQSSDTTWRLHDWGRGRPVHLAEARQACLDHAPEHPRRAPGSGAFTTLIDEPAFALHSATVRGALSWAPSRGCGFLTVLDGRGEIADGGRVHVVRPGDTLLVSGEVSIAGHGPDGLQLLAVDGPR
jgi:mannose-6-phosphate isomerase